MAEVSTSESVQRARADYEQSKQDQRPYLVEVQHLAKGLPMRTINHWINGQTVATSAERTGAVYDLATGQQAAQAYATGEDVDAAVRAAQAASRPWRDTSIVKRLVMFAFRDLLEKHRDELASIIASEHGKVVPDAAGEVQRGLEVVEVARIPHLLKGDFERLHRGRLLPRSASRWVAAGITPFNFPIMVPMWMHPIAIACGNAFVPAVRARPVGVHQVAELYAEAGLPDGNHRRAPRGDKVAVDAILDHPGIQAVSFVGSTRSPATSTSVAPPMACPALGGAKNHADHARRRHGLGCRRAGVGRLRVHRPALHGHLHRGVAGKAGDALIEKVLERPAPCAPARARPPPTWDRWSPAHPRTRCRA